MDIVRLGIYDRRANQPQNMTPTRYRFGVYEELAVISAPTHRDYSVGLSPNYCCQQDSVAFAQPGLMELRYAKVGQSPICA